VLSVLADPLGINALKKMTEYWTASVPDRVRMGSAAVADGQPRGRSGMEQLAWP
jgi:hypothetical protein